MIKIEAIAAKLDFGTVFPPEKENSKKLLVSVSI